MRYRRGKGEKAFDAANAFVLLCVCAFTLVPAIYIIAAALSGRGISSFSTAASSGVVTAAMRNTVLVTACGTLLSTALTVCGGYFLSRGARSQGGVKRMGSLWKFCAGLIVLTLFIGDGNPVPLYIAVKNMRLLDTFWALTLPVAANTAAIVMMAAAFARVPREYIDAALAEGAGHITILTRIAMPIARPVISVIALYTAAKYWNGWFHASIYLPSNRDLYTIQLIIREYYADITATPEKYAVIALSIVPIMLVYPFRRRQFTRAIEFCAMKS